MKHPLVVTAIAATVLSMAGAVSAAGASHSPVRQGEAQLSASGGVVTVLYEQTTTPDGRFVNSQDFPTSVDSRDNQAADDFVVPAGQTWLVQNFGIVGQYGLNGTKPASMRITIYKSKGGKPGKVVADFPTLGVTDFGADLPCQGNGAGAFSCTLPRDVKLKAGTYWVSFQAKFDDFEYVGWGWNTRAPAEGSTGMFRNPGDGFFTGCVDWSPLAACTRGTQTGDFMFQVVGTSR